MTNKLALIGALGALTLCISGCSDDDKAALTSLIPTTTTLSGVAAMGAPIVGGTVSAKDAEGDSQTMPGLTDDDGNWEMTLVNFTPPIIVRVEGGFVDGNPFDSVSVQDTAAETQVSMATSAADGTLNLTPLTTLAVQQAAGQTDLAILYQGWDATRPTAAELAASAAVIRANLAPAPSAAAITNWATYDFFTTAFVANHTGIDALMDTVICGAATVSEALQVTCSGVTYNPDISTEGFVVGGSSGTGTPVAGGGTGTLTASASTPASGNGTLTLTGAEVTVDGTLTRVQAEGNGFIVKVYYTTATGAVTNVSYFWGNVNFDNGMADNVVFCTGTCGATVDTVANTVTLSSSALSDGAGSLATLNGTISGLALADLAGGGGCTINCQMTATYTSSFTIPAIPFSQAMPETTETVSGTLAGLTTDAIRTSVINENNEFGTPTNIVVNLTTNTATRKTFSVTFTAIVNFGGQQTANYTQTYDYVQL